AGPRPRPSVGRLERDLSRRSWLIPAPEPYPGPRDPLVGRGRWRGMALASSGPSERPQHMAEGDTGALLSAFLEKRQNLVLFLAARMRSAVSAEDLVQDLYLKIAAM